RRPRRHGARRALRPAVLRRRAAHHLQGDPMTTQTPDVLIRLEGLTKQYPGQQRPAVDHLDLAILEVEIGVLVGPSGCGQTTTLNIINPISEPTTAHNHPPGYDV